MYAKCYTYHSTDLEIFKSEYKTEFYRVIDKICTKERSIITTSGWSPLGIVGKLRIALDKDNFFRIAHKRGGGGVTTRLSPAVSVAKEKINIWLYWK